MRGKIRDCCEKLPAGNRNVLGCDVIEQKYCFYELFVVLGFLWVLEQDFGELSLHSDVSRENSYIDIENRIESNDNCYVTVRNYWFIILCKVAWQIFIVFWFLTCCLYNNNNNKSFRNFLITIIFRKKLIIFTSS